MIYFNLLIHFNYFNLPKETLTLAALAPGVKMTYLTNLCKGEAEACIQGIVMSNDNYEIALRMLKERFGDEKILISAHINKLLNLDATSNYVDVKEMRTLYNNIEVQVHSLRGSGLKKERGHGPMFAPVIMSKLPQKVNLNHKIRKRHLGY